MANVQTQSRYEISIVIGTFNRPTVLQDLLNQLLNEPEKPAFEVLVFDQSTEENYQQTKKNFPQQNNFSLHRLEKPNTCKYLNLGWEKANAPILLYLDDDVSITKTTIKAHLGAYADQSILGVAGRVINDNEHVSHNPKVGRITNYGAVITKHFSYEKPVFVDFPYGCNMSFRKDILKKMQGFDEKLQPPIYAFNEVDLGVRISQSNPFSLKFEPEALVYHHKYKTGGTRSFTQKELQKSINYNYGYFLGKNFNLLQNTTCFLRRLPFQLIKEPGYTKDILSGFWYAKNIK